MEARHIAIYKLLGATKLPGDAETIDLAALPRFFASAKLTTNPEPFCVHIDRALAVALGLGKALFREGDDGTPAERLAAETEGVRKNRSERFGTGVFMVFEGTGDVPAPDFKIRRDLDNFAFCMDAFDKRAFADTFRPAVHAILTALGLALPEQADRRIEKLSEVSYLLEPGTDKVIYSFTAEMGTPTVSIGSPVPKEAVEHVGKLAPILVADDTSDKIAGLLVESLETQTSDLRSFIAAWAALEIFVNAMFRKTYDKKWLESLAAGAPASAKLYFARLKDVMSDKYRLVDKFVVIASLLDPTTAENDTAQFKALKDARDGLFHPERGAAARFPVEETQKLLQKYMQLHLDSLAAPANQAPSQSAVPAIDSASRKG